MAQPKLSMISPEELIPNDWNTNIVPPDNETKLEESIRRNGLFKPVIVREKNGILEIIGGEHRWAISRKMGMSEIPIVNLGPIDDAKAREISVIDNARYGADDTLALADLLKSIGDQDELQDFLPFTDNDIEMLFSSADIALDDLDIDENFDRPAENPEPPAAKAPKTHTVMRFKLSLNDAERLTALIAKTQRKHGYTTSDDLTNAGDALVHLLSDQFAGKDPGKGTVSQEIETLLEQIQ